MFEHIVMMVFFQQNTPTHYLWFFLLGTVKNCDQDQRILLK
jgi:hypothetical protein